MSNMIFPFCTFAYIGNFHIECREDGKVVLLPYWKYFDTQSWLLVSQALKISEDIQWGRREDRFQVLWVEIRLSSSPCGNSRCSVSLSTAASLTSNGGNLPFHIKALRSRLLLILTKQGEHYPKIPLLKISLHNGYNPRGRSHVSQ